MKNAFILLILLLFPVLVQISFASNCLDEAKFFGALDPARNTWKDVYQLFKTNKGCDDGVFAEGYSDFVAQSLARRWDHFPELVTLVANDSSFHDFILHHIDATTDEDDLTALLNNVRTLCPSDSKIFCKEIEKAALSAIEDFEIGDGRTSQECKLSPILILS